MAPMVWANVLFASCTVIGQTGQNVMLPLFADVIASGGGSPYFVVWFASFSFVILLSVIVFGMWCSNQFSQSERASMSITAQWCFLQIGLADALNGMMVVFASPSSRTAPYLQAILGNFTIPMTIIARKLLLKTSPSCIGMFAASLVLIGLFVSLIPSIFSWDGPDVQTIQSVLWPIWFMAGFVPAAVMNVLEERALKHDLEKVHSVWLVFWLNFWQLVFVSSLFWLDIVPGYGMSENFVTWAQHMHNGFFCFLPGDRCGLTGLTRGAAFIIFYLLAYLASALLLRYSEGATWQVLVTALVTPLGAFWWTLFQEKPTLHWEPEWATTTTFSLLGMVFMVPGIVIYRWKGSTETNDIERSLLEFA